MALAKRSRGGMTGWVAAALLALAVYSANTGDETDATPDDQAGIEFQADAE